MCWFHGRCTDRLGGMSELLPRVVHRQGKVPHVGVQRHELCVLHVCSMFAGRFNDKTKILYDDYVKKLRTDYYAGFDYNLTDERGW